ncbi:MAG: GNAT family N-acetyltransferase [Thermomicrobiales bacterium]|nr:GNAT family N-acetyltransferase [Thermomicrobiales bacterium]
MAAETQKAGWISLPAAERERAAANLAACPQLGSVEAALTAIDDVAASEGGGVFAWLEGEDLVAVYGLRKTGISFAMEWLAVAPARQGQRYGRSALMDALRRCGRSPMTVQADDALVGWYQRIGFKIVGRKPLPGGGFRYRLGWYAPRRPDEPGYGVH